MLVPEDQLMRFNGINATLQSIIQFAAPAASGALLTLGGLRATLFIDIATAVVGIGLLSCIALPRMQQQPEEPQSVFADVQGGLSYIRKEGFLRNNFV